MRLSHLAFIAVVCSAQAAHADFALGLFLGEPTGVDMKIGLAPHSGLDIVAGWNTIDSDHANYAHVTYLVTPLVGRGSSVLVPIRLGIGGAVFDSGGPFGDRIDLAVRAPFEVGLRFRHVPLELYGEIAAVVVFVHDSGFDIDGGVGLRFYF